MGDVCVVCDVLYVLCCVVCVVLCCVVLCCVALRCVALCCVAVSYTHLTLPTMAIV